MIFYYEFDKSIVDSHNEIPATLCYSVGNLGFRDASLANRIYIVEDNVVRDIKNRYGVPGTTYFISNENKVVLKLKAVPL